MYAAVQQSGRRTRIAGIAATVLMTAGAGWVFAEGMKKDYERMKENTMEMVILAPPEPAPPVEEIKKPEIVEKVAPPEAPPLVAPDIDFVVETPPVITAPVADPVPIPTPIPVAPAPAAGTDRLAPKLRAGAKPDYPAASVRAGEHGTTHLEVCVSTAGRVSSVSIAGSSGSQRLDEAAAKWLRNERFTPGSVGGVAQSMCGHDVYYEWNLKDVK